MFISENFTFNGKSNLDYNVISVEFNVSVLNDIGVMFNRQISKDDSSCMLTFTVEDGDVEDIVLNLMLINENGLEKEWTREDMLRVKNWLIQDDFKPFTSEDNPEDIYYVQCSSIKNKFTFGKYGVLEVTFKVMDHYAYHKYDNTINVNGDLKGIINNPSNKIYSPIIEVTNKGTLSTINKINDMEITGLNTDETIVIDNLMLTVLNKDVNKFNCCNRKWIHLSPGENILSLSGNCLVRVLAEFPIIL